ncbi:hypothetical protein FSC25_07480, partial [Mycobacterium tuberculosis variant bovis]
GTNHRDTASVTPTHPPRGTHNTDTETQRAPISCRNGVLLRLLGPGPRSCQEFAEGCAGVCGHVVFVFR